MSSLSLRSLALSLPVIAALLPGAALSQQDRRVVIINDTDRPVYHFHASNTSRRSWEEDILRERVLMPGESVRVNIDDGSGRCMFDLKATFNNGNYVTRMGFNVCRESQWVIR